MTALRRWLITLSITSAAVMVAATGVAAAGTTWPTYHATNDRQGVDTDTGLSPSTQAWRSSLDGAVYGQPVVEDGRVFAATENDTVYALDAHDGKVLWSTHLGTPLTGVSGATGCGDIDPLGITSTPVIDPNSGTVYVVTEEASGSGTSVAVHHQLVGLNPFTGATTSSTSADPPIGSVTPSGQNLKWLQQRGALILANGRVYVSYGGLSGDCGLYHGWVVGVDVDGSSPTVSFNATPGGQGGAIWEPSGPAVDASGNVWVTTGNPNNPDDPPVGYSESVVKLSPTLAVLGSYRDTKATGDADLATNGVTLLPGGLAFATGKTKTGYLLNQSDLSLVASIPNVCGSDPDGGNAYLAATNTLYVPCRGGDIQPVNLTTHAAGTPIAGVNGPPILADGQLWAANYGSSSLFEINPATGTKTQTLATGATVPTFGSPSAALGLVLIGTSAGVTAFAGPAGPPAAAPPPPAGKGYLVTDDTGNVHAFGGAPYEGGVTGKLTKPVVGMATTPDGKGYWLVAADGGVFAYGDAGFYGSAGALKLTAPVVGMAATPDGKGYWLVAADGGIFNYGDAHFYGSQATLRLTKPVVGMASNAAGTGYWLVAADGGIFADGSVGFFGSAGNLKLAAPVVGMATNTAGSGYWLVASDGGIFSYGSVGFFGSEGGARLSAPITGMSAPDDGGYRMVARDGGVFAFGDASFSGSLAGASGPPVVGIASAG